jgi:hypothetical protein
VAAHVAARRVDIPGLGDYLEVGHVGQQHLKPAPDDLMIVRQHDPDRSGIPAARVFGRLW